MKWEKSIFWARESCMNGTVGFIGIFSHRKFSAIFASPNRYFTQSSRWVPQALFIGFVCSGIVVCLFVCFLSLALSSVSCWRGCLRFAKWCSLCSAVCCCLLLRCWKIFSGEDFQPVGESSVVMLAFVAFNCSLFTNGNHCFADAEQTTLSHE